MQNKSNSFIVFLAFLLVAMFFVVDEGGKPVSKTIASDIGEAIVAYAREHGISPHIVHSIIEVESGFDPLAKGKDGEVGLMQLMPGTAKELGVKDRTDPVDNVKGGIRYLAKCKKLTGKAYLRCYNGGPGGIHLAQTKAYEHKVLSKGEELLKEHEAHMAKGRELVAKIDRDIIALGLLK